MNSLILSTTTLFYEYECHNPYVEGVLAFDAGISPLNRRSRSAALRSPLVCFSVILLSVEGTLNSLLHPKTKVYCLYMITTSLLTTYLYYSLFFKHLSCPISFSSFPFWYSYLILFASEYEYSLVIDLSMAMEGLSMSTTTLIYRGFQPLHGKNVPEIGDHAVPFCDRRSR